MLDEHIIRDYNHKTYTKEEFLEQVKEYDRKGFNAYIGTDSKIVKRKVAIVTAVIFHDSSNGGKIFYMKDRVSMKECPNLRMRMMLEAYRSVETAMELEKYLHHGLEIHLDVGDDVIKNKTSAYEKELQTLVVGQGYVCEIKPNSWASSSVADRFVKN
jgi:predicted RNase H-related nuclease YkuK (DUF458 family)